MNIIIFEAEDFESVFEGKKNFELKIKEKLFDAVAKVQIEIQNGYSNLKLIELSINNCELTLDENLKESFELQFARICINAPETRRKRFYDDKLRIEMPQNDLLKKFMNLNHNTIKKLLIEVEA